MIKLENIAENMRHKVTAPKNPKLIREPKKVKKVKDNKICLFDTSFLIKKIR